MLKPWFLEWTSGRDMHTNLQGMYSQVLSKWKKKIRNFYCFVNRFRLSHLWKTHTSSLSHISEYRQGKRANERNASASLSMTWYVKFYTTHKTVEPVGLLPIGPAPQITTLSMFACLRYKDFVRRMFLLCFLGSPKSYYSLLSFAFHFLEKYLPKLTFW